MRVSATKGHRLDPVAPPAKGAPPPPRGAPPSPPGPQGGAASSAPPAQVKLEPGARGPAQAPGRVDVISLIESDDEEDGNAAASNTTTVGGETEWQW